MPKARGTTKLPSSPRSFHHPTGQVSASKSSRSLGVDVLRGIAVLAVVLCHAPFSSRSFGQANAAETFPSAAWTHAMQYGEYGVHLFLVISGFCIHMKWAKRADCSQGIAFIPFWKRRLIRLYPPYLVTLVAALALTYVYNAVVLGSTQSIAARFGYSDLGTFALDIFLLIFLAQNLTRASWRVNNGPFWSLALEEQLYLLYFPLLHLRRRYGWLLTAVFVAAVSFGWRAFGVWFFGADVPVYWSIVGPAFWLPWLLGAWAGEVFCGHGSRLVTAKVWFVLAVATMAFAIGLVEPLADQGAFAAGISRMSLDLTFAIGCFFLLMAVTVHDRENPSFFSSLGWRGLAQVGVWSYSIYLTHLLVVVPLKHLLVRLGADPAIILVARIAIPVAFAWVFFKWVELPAHRRARKVQA